MTMQWIAGYTVTASGGDASVVFNSIPQTFTHLQLRSFDRSTITATSDILRIRFNSDSGSNYARHGLYGDGATTYSVGVGSVTAASGGAVVAANGLANTFGESIVDILDYTNTNKYKTVKTLYGQDQNGSGEAGLASSLWLNTAAITSLTLFMNQAGANIAQGSRFDLYGITTSELTGA